MDLSDSIADDPVAHFEPRLDDEFVIHFRPNGNLSLACNIVILD
jgi:hypothetical protein